MTYKEDVEEIIGKLQGRIDRLTKAIQRSEEKIQENEQEITVLKSLMEGLPEREPKLFGAEVQGSTEEVQLGPSVTLSRKR